MNSQVEKIKTEIVELIKHDELIADGDSKMNELVNRELETLYHLSKFIDSLQEEPVSNDLEAEFVLYLKHKFNIPQEGDTLKTDGWSPSPYDLLDIAKHFAQWQKKQESKEVDLEKEIHNAADQYDINNNGNIYWEDIVGFAKHFFELGLKAKGE